MAKYGNMGGLTMGTVFHCLMIVLLFLLSILVLIIILPWEYKISLISSPEPCLEINGGIWRLLRVKYRRGRKSESTLSLAGINFPFPYKLLSNDNSKGKKQAKRNHDWKVKLTRLINKDYLEQLIQIIKVILAILKPSFIIKGRLGFDEPHHTAWLMAVIGIVTAILPDNSVDLEPVWDEECVDFYLQVYGKITICFIITRLISLLITRFVRQLKTKGTVLVV